MGRSNIKNVWVGGEISSFKLYNSGHAYFILKDEDSEISCVWFNYNSQKKLNNGLKVTISGDVTIYSNRGKFQIIVNNSYLTGLGNQSLKLKQLKKKLLNEGLFDKKYKKELPPFPLCIGILTSLNGSVIKDIYGQEWPGGGILPDDIQFGGLAPSWLGTLNMGDVVFPDTYLW